MRYKSFSDYRPRHVLCFLGPKGGFQRLLRSVQASIEDLAVDFEIDMAFSQDASDDRMSESFSVCWDQVHEDAWHQHDVEVMSHGCVVYVVGPLMEVAETLAVSVAALMLVKRVLEAGATAAKGESAGVAHGAARWRQLAREAEGSEPCAVARACRLAFTKRPITDGDFFSSVGFHLVGLPEVFVPASSSMDELALSAMIDSVADEMAADGVEAVVARHGAKLKPSMTLKKTISSTIHSVASILPPLCIELRRLTATSAQEGRLSKSALGRGCVKTPLRRMVFRHQSWSGGIG